MQTYLNLIKVDMDDFFAVRADFRHLPIKVDRVSTAGAACNDYTDDFCFLLHGSNPFEIAEYWKCPTRRQVLVTQI
jgi:hypothetical protein